MSGQRVLFCGSRDWAWQEPILAEMKRLRPSVVIEGEAHGADQIARAAAEDLGIDVLAFPANWREHGRAAGPIRNQRMLDEGKPDLVVAFHPDLEASKGTKDMVRRARKAGVPVRVIER